MSREPVKVGELCDFSEGRKAWLITARKPFQNVKPKSRITKSHSDHMNNHMICMRGKDSDRSKPSSRYRFDSSKSAEQLDRPWFVSAAKQGMLKRQDLCGTLSDLSFFSDPEPN